MIPSPERTRKVYRGEALRAVAMPLGGIGTGTIALGGDGSLRQWQIHNQINHLACVPHSFFAVWAQPDRRRMPVPKTALVLQSGALYDTNGPASPPTSNDHLVPGAHRQLLEQLPGVEATEFAGGYPIAEVAYRDSSLPVDVALEAFCPFIPLSSKDSGLPTILFNFSVANPTDETMLVSLAATLQNAVGWDAVVPIRGTRCSLYGGNRNTLVRLGNMTAIDMGNARLPDDHPSYGSMALATFASDPTYLTQWDDLGALWNEFSSRGRLGNLEDSQPSLAGRTWNGALAVPFALEPGESHEVTFLLTWYYPNRYVDWSQGDWGVEDEKSKFWLGNRYSTWFRSALDVACYVRDNCERLTEGTRLARDTFYDTTLPYALIDSVTSQVSVLRSPTCFWAEDGRFYGFEGCAGASALWNGGIGGSCPLNCTHVWNYEMALARLYPELERTMRETEWEIQQHPSGYLPHRVVVPPYLPRLWDRRVGGPRKPALDGLLGAILKTYREYRVSGDVEWLSRMWPSVKQAMSYVWSEHDQERSGVIENEQPNTYDISIYGANTFIGTLYLAALRSVETMANLLDEEDLAHECRDVYRHGSEALDRRLWNGEYYIQDVNLEKYAEQNWGIGCHADQLLGQWWAHVLGLGYVLDPERVRRSALSIFKHNFREGFHCHKQWPRVFVTDDDEGLLNCTWPNGGRPEVPTRYSDEVWTGIEYEVAGLLLYEGEVDAALRVLEATRTRYDGRKQNPWNDIECGDHYVRAMASWALLDAASGYQYDAGAAEIGFAPAIGPEEFVAPFFARDGWGSFAQRVTEKGQEESLSLAYGSLEIERLLFRVQGSVETGEVTLDGDAVPAGIARTGSEVVVTLPRRIIVDAGQKLVILLATSS